MFRPQAETYVPDNTWYLSPRGGVLDTNGYESVQLENGPMLYKLGIYSVFQGQADFVQLITGDLGSDIWPPFTITGYQADTSVPYNGTTAVKPDGWSAEGITFQDGPTTEGGSSSAYLDFTFKDYLRFTPDGAGSIPITIGLVNWSVQLSEVKSGGIWTIGCVCPAPIFSESSEFPSWALTYTFPYLNP